MDRKLIPLDEYNKSKNDEYLLSINSFIQTGLACPQCGKELMEFCNAPILMSYPPRKNVHCECGFKGTRIAKEYI